MTRPTAAAAPPPFAFSPRAGALPRLARSAAAAGRSALAAAAEALYPPACLDCRAELASARTLCPDCWSGAVFLASPVCNRCGAPTPDVIAAGDAPVCDQCLDEDFAFDRARAACLYEGVGRRLVLRLKHSDRTDLARPAAGWMLRAGAQLAAEADCVIPVPLHRRRFLSRRANQAAELSRWVAWLADRRHETAALIRVRPTPPQKGRDRAARAANLEGAFAVRPGARARLAGRRVLLVDDVLTTGATLSAAAAALKGAGAASVDALVLARVAATGGMPISCALESEDP